MGSGNPHNYPWFCSGRRLKRYIYDVKSGAAFNQYELPEFAITIEGIDHDHADTLAAKIGLSLGLMLTARG